MKLIDTHCHVNFNAYKDDADQVIKRCLDEDIYIINVGSQIDTSRSAVKIAENYPKGVWAAIGLHPTHTVAHGYDDKQELVFQPRAEAFDYEEYEQMLSSSKKIVAVGEIGLDYYRLPEDRSVDIKKAQYKAFIQQYEFAHKHNLPLIVHCRDAHADQLAVLKEFDHHPKGVIHCYTGTYQEAVRYIDEGWLISFTGIAVFAPEVAEVARKLPLDSIMVETDAPYLSPPPFRGKRNEPLYVKYVAQDMAKRRKITFDEFACATNKNAVKLFNLVL